MPINFADLDAEDTMEVNASSEVKNQQAETKENPHKNLSLAMAYVMWQEWRKIYDYEKGLSRGTIFEELDLPFTAYKGGMER